MILSQKLVLAILSLDKGEENAVGWLAKLAGRGLPESFQALVSVAANCRQVLARGVPLA